MRDGAARRVSPYHEGCFEANSRADRARKADATGPGSSSMAGPAEIGPDGGVSRSPPARRPMISGARTSRANSSSATVARRRAAEGARRRPPLGSHRGRRREPSLPAALQPGLQTSTRHSTDLRSAEPLARFADRESVLQARSASAQGRRSPRFARNDCTVTGLWNGIGRLVDCFTPTECTNFFATAGFDAF